jgi:methanethiol S-methyltransferase
VIAFWAIPGDDSGPPALLNRHNGYMLLAIQFEEHDLIEHFEDAHRNYRKSTPMILPFLKRSR